MPSNGSAAPPGPFSRCVLGPHGPHPPKVGAPEVTLIGHTHPCPSRLLCESWVVCALFLRRLGLLWDIFGDGHHSRFGNLLS